MLSYIDEIEVKNECDSIGDLRGVQTEHDEAAGNDAEHIQADVHHVVIPVHHESIQTNTKNKADHSRCT